MRYQDVPNYQMLHRAPHLNTESVEMRAHDFPDSEAYE